MRDLEQFSIPTADFCNLTEHNPSTVATWVERFRAFGGPQSGEKRAWRLADAMEFYVADRLRRAGLKAGQAWKFASGGEVLAAYMVDGFIRFGLIDGELSRSYDAETPVLEIQLERAGRHFSNAFAAFMVRDHGGPAAAAALDDFDQRCRALRDGEVIE